MKKTLTILATTTALTAALGLPGHSAAPGPYDAEIRRFTATTEAALMPPFVLASTDDDDGEQGDSDNSHEADDDDECETDTRCSTGTDPAPSGSVSPPQNGLFGNGAAPQVQVN